MKRILAIALLGGLFFIFPCFSFAQKKSGKENFNENHTPFGKKKKERKNQRGTAGKISRGGGLFRKRERSQGNANAFAKNSTTGNHGFIHKLFHPGGSGERNASLRKTKPGKVQNREQKHLFRRLMSNNKGRHEKIQDNQRKERKRNRKRGNDVFKDKKR